MLISIVAVVIVALVILGVVISRPTQVELVEAQSASEASTIKGVLEDNNISYEVDSKLVFFVNKSDEVNAIMALGDNGIPAQAYSIDNVTDGSFSTTEADKQKKYQVYLEDKLKDHLEKQSYVNEASVDITMPDKDGTILKSKEEATAAVTLGLKDSITDDQAYAIARLVATALGNDTTKGITIIDKKANVLYSGGDSDTSAGLATSQLSYKQKLEEQVKNEVKKTLESSNIFSNIEVGMNLDIDFSKTETAQKNYTLPDGQTDTGLLDSESNYQSDATNGQAAVPGTDSNSDDTTYTTQDGTPSESSITDNDKKYLNDEKITTSKNDGGSIKYDSSSITVVATRYKVYDESTLEKNGKLKDTSWEEYKAKHADPVKVTDVDQDLVTSVQNATGISQISFLVYEQPEFVDKASGVRSLSDILQIAITVLIFALLAVAFFVTGKNLDKKAGIESIEDETAQAESDAEEIRKPENVVSLLQVDPIELEFGYGIIPLADVNQGGDLLDRVVMIRRQIALELGTVVPIIRLRDNIQLNPNQYIIKIKGIQVTEGEILFDHYMAMNPGYVEEEITGIPTFEPSFHLPAIWITESQRERAESLGYTVVDPPSIIATHLTEVIRSHIAELLTRQDVQNLVNNLKESNPVIVDELIPKLLGLGEIQKVLQNLLSEGISIRDLLTIFETLADHAQTTRDTDVLTEYVRQGLKRAISSKYFPANETTSVITLDPAVEQEIMSSVKQTEQGSYLSLDPDRIKAIIKSVETEIGKLESLGKSAIIITSPIVRMYFKKMTEDYFKDLIVLSYNEVESNVELQSVGMVTA